LRSSAIQNIRREAQLTPSELATKWRASDDDEYGAESAMHRKNQPPRRANQWSAAAAEPSLEFGRFRVLLRQRLLLADGVPIELGTRAFEFLLALLEAGGSLVRKKDLLARVWPDTIVVEQNLKVQVSALRRALGEDRDFIRTEFGRASSKPVECGSSRTVAQIRPIPGAAAATANAGARGHSEGPWALP
jgi:DNA-binding response OmpR family regulator